MEIDIAEIIRLNGRLIDTKGELNTTLGKVEGELNTVFSNIGTEGIYQANSDLIDKMNELSSKVTGGLSRLTEFLTIQMENYKVTNEEATKALESLVNAIKEKFDENGNIIITATATATSGTENSVNTTTISESEVPTAGAPTRMADPNINDNDAYTNGSSLMSSFEEKIGSRWDVVDTTYYFFKEKGLSDEQIAGILGNMAEESTLKEDIDTGTYKGLFQFGGGRRAACSEYGWDVESQLEYAWAELQSTESKAMKDISSQTTVVGSVASWAEKFERCGTQGRTNREKWAKACYNYIKDNL